MLDLEFVINAVSGVTNRCFFVSILTIKWFATANLLNACPCLLTCGLWPPETILKGRRVSIYAEKWLAPVLTSYASSRACPEQAMLRHGPVLTSYASSRADVANPRFQTMNVWTVSPTFIVLRAGRQRQSVTTSYCV